jgi:hypothetical protein
MDTEKMKDVQNLDAMSAKALPELHEIRARWPEGTSADIDRLLQIIHVQGDIQTHRGLLEAAIELLQTIRDGQSHRPGGLEPAVREQIDAFLKLATAGPARALSADDSPLGN